LARHIIFLHIEQKNRSTGLNLILQKSKFLSATGIVFFMYLCKWEDWFMLSWLPK